MHAHPVAHEPQALAVRFRVIKGVIEVRVIRVNIMVQAFGRVPNLL